MKTIHRLSFFCIALLLSLTAVHAQSYTKLWKKVERAREKDLPQSVISLTDEIFRKAEREKNAGQLFKAYLMREHTQESLTPDSMYTRLDEMQRWAEAEENPVNKAILHSLLAEAYADYMVRNSYALSQRTELDEEEAPADMREWTARQFMEKVDAHALASVHPADRLLDTPMKSYVPLVEVGEQSRYYDYDLYHLLCRRALDAYRQWGGFRRDSLRKERIGALYEEMLAAYKRKNLPDAQLFTELDYSNWKYQVNKFASDEAYLQALTGLQQRYADRLAVVEVIMEKARLLRRMNRYTEALRLCEAAIKRYASSDLIVGLKNEILLINRSSLESRFSEEVYPGKPLEIIMRHRNLKCVTMKLYATDFLEIPTLEEGITQKVLNEHARLLSTQRFDLLPNAHADSAPEDWMYMPNDTVIHFATPTVPGLYVLQLEADDADVAPVSHFFTSTRIKVVVLPIGDNRQEIWTVDSESGKPLSDVSVKFFSAMDKDKRHQQLVLRTDADGKAQCILPSNGRQYFVAHKREDCFMRMKSFYPYGNYQEEEKREPQLTLLTDRSIYRPGQTLYVKGVAYRQHADSAGVMADKEYEVRLLDANRKEVAKKLVRTNAFGSFAAEFVLPTSTLNGTFTIQAGNSRTTVRVEEYKRPTFEVKIDPITKAYCLGDTAWVKGRVLSFNGAAVQDVPLAYAVKSLYRCDWRSSEESHVADTIQLGADGRFAFPVVLQRPRHLPAQEVETVTCEVQMSITNSAGETQSAGCTLTASTHPIHFTVDLPGELCREEMPSTRFCITDSRGEVLELDGVARLHANAAGHLSILAAWESPFRSGERIELSAWSKLPCGFYTLCLSAKDSRGKEHSKRVKDIQIFSEKDTRLHHTPMNTFIYKKNMLFDEETDAEFFYATTHPESHVQMNLFDETGRRIENHSMVLNDTLLRLTIPYRKEYGKGISVQLTFVKEGKSYTVSERIMKRQPDRALRMKWAVFRDKLRPGQQEEWKLTIQSPDGKPADAEMLALLYDASLDMIYRRGQQLRLLFGNYIPMPRRITQDSGYMIGFSLDFPLNLGNMPVLRLSRFYNPFQAYIRGFAMTKNAAAPVYALAAAEGGMLQENAVMSSRKDAVLEDVAFEEEQAAVEEPVAVDETSFLRTHFAETAFFYPHLRTNEQGEILLSFTLPESLTRWNFQGFAHTREMLTGQLEASVIAAKEFMLMPNLPRFLRMGDRVQMAASIVNRTDKQVKGTAVLTLFDPATERILLTRREKFAGEAGENTPVSFEVDMTHPKLAPYEGRLLGVRIIADGGKFSDGEQHLLPVLSNKEYITETLALPIRGGETRTFALDSLFNRRSPSATDRRLTVEFTGNPAWYAVQALPELTRPEGDNAPAWAMAYYANRLAQHIVNRNPQIRPMLQAWHASGKREETLRSQLEKNPELKTILLAETPWLLEATSESERMARLVQLLDENRQADLERSAIARLKALQNEEGSWSWFKGMPGSRYMTTYIVELLTRLSGMTGQPLPHELTDIRKKALNYLKNEAEKEHRRMVKAEKQGAKYTHLSPLMVDYLYLSAKVNRELGIPTKMDNHFLKRLYNHLSLPSISLKARSAYILYEAEGLSAADNRNNDLGKAGEFLASIREHLIQEKEMGAHFAFLDTPYRWGMMPIPTHVSAMEALGLDAGNASLLEEMRVWLLKQKQTTMWNSPVATADAVYALLVGGANPLENEGEVAIKLGNTALSTASPQATLGITSIKETYTQGDKELDATSITVSKLDDGIAWGALYAQYLSPVADVKQQGGELGVEKKLYVERIAPDGKPSLQPITPETRLHVGDKVVSRLVLRTDRALDFVQLKDQRGACFEPLESLSGYQWNRGLGYYAEVEDAATNFFFDSLGKGVYVLEHRYRVARSGTYQAGIATVQCAYAPEFAAHSAGQTVVVFTIH